MDAARLTCKRCKEEVSEGDLNHTQLMAHCRRCNAVFDISAQLREAQGLGQQRRRAEVPMPEGATVSRSVAPAEDRSSSGHGRPYRSSRAATIGELKIEQRWANSRVLRRGWIIVLPFALVLGALPFLLRLIVAEGESTLVFSATGVVSFPFALVLGLSSLAMGLNTMVITVSDNQLKVTTGPIALFRSRQLSTDDITQLYCERVESSSSYVYRLRVAMKARRKVVTLVEHGDQELVLFLEQQIEEHLGIIDVAVAGEAAQTADA